MLDEGVYICVFECVCACVCVCVYVCALILSVLHSIVKYLRLWFKVSTRSESIIARAVASNSFLSNHAHFMIIPINF